MRKQFDVSSQPGKKDDLDGSAPDSSEAALLLVDLINDFGFPGGDELLAGAAQIAGPIRQLKIRARAAGIPAIYVNDNFGRWQSSFKDVVERCLAPNVKGHCFVEQLKPEPEDYFVLKPKHSAFYQTPLDVLLKHLGTKRIVLAGLSTNSCILITANDAYMRDLEVYVPSDCVATQTAEEQEYSLKHMENVNKAIVCASAEIDLEKLAGRSWPETLSG